MRHAIVDFGSNTIRLCIYELEDNASEFVQIYNKKNMAGLISYFDKNGNLSNDGIEKAIEILLSCKRKINNLQCDTSHVFATAIMRRAKNADEIIERIKEETGFHIDVISGEQEAAYGFLGSMKAVDITEGVQIDIGGASTELVVFKDRTIVFSKSFAFGSLSLYLKFVSALMPTKKELHKIRDYVKDELKATPELENITSNQIVGIGGSIRAGGKIRDDWLNDNLIVKQPYFSLDELDNILAYVKENPKKSVKKILQVVPDRVHTAIPGLVCAKAIASYFGADAIIISRYGVREGYLLTKALVADAN
ncbi:MAG: phosphatase [Coriobacteriia bacterium]|nr:phosphatase [Coriobacteriia bacterium]